MSNVEKIYVLNPTAQNLADVTSPGPDVGNLKGKVVGFRLDIMWRAWDTVSEVWAEAFKSAGAAKVVFWRAGGRTGSEGERMKEELHQFIQSIDVAVFGLANCGSCTGWTIHDALAAADRGLHTVAVATESFDSLAKNLARRAGRSGLRLHVLPYPLNERLEDDVRQIARQHIPLILNTMGAAVLQKAVA